MCDQPVDLVVEGGLAAVTLNRPAAGNTIDMALAQALLVVAESVAAEPKVRCVTITGAGRLFCGGGDLKAMSAAGHCPAEYLFELAGTLHEAVVTLATMPKPLVTLVNGPAAGAGFSLALLGDVVLAGRSAHFTPAYGSVGLTPDGGMTWLLPRLVGLRRAQELILTNRRVDAEGAVAMGLVTRVVDDGALAEEGLAAALALARGPVSALAGARALLARSFDRDLPTQLAAEAASIRQAGGGPELAEGVSAFVARRPPDFLRERLA